MSIGHGADPGFLAVSLQVVGCRYFQPGPRLMLGKNLESDQKKNIEKASWWSSLHL